MEDNHFKKSEETWNSIAESFDNTRRKPWKQTSDFIDYLNKKDVVADLGCGNGRHLILCAKKCKYVVALDISNNLIKIAEKKAKDKLNTFFVHGNCVYIPLINNIFDSILYIASLHNIKGRDNRIKSLIELKRILKPGGKALISVWSREQERFKEFLNKDPKAYDEFGDIDIYWRQNQLNIPRFYHLYSKKEFIEDINQSGLKVEKVIEAKIKSKNYVDNYFIIASKSL